MKQIEASSGQGWARAAVVVGAVLSVAGNATETVLTTSTVALAIRIIIATFLPVIVFIAVEVFVRVAWRRKPLDFIGRAMLLLLPSFGAAYVSFGHLYDLSRLGGGDEIASAMNALAIDGLMIGGTVALLAIRAARLAAMEPVTEPEVERIAPPIPMPLPALPVETAPHPSPASEREHTRRQRSTSADQRKAIELLIEDKNGKGLEAVSAGLMGLSTMRRYAAVLRDLKQAPQGPINERARKVQPELVEMIRAAVTA